ncbi:MULTISPECIES: hypothetical protein [unclassified Shewanella]|nr:MULTISPECIES: hypothetical protein [unclassified Shewanella]GIU14810.1 hypothetical protein TUM4444_25080 [Shewanella sp. MBTL60-112-B1]GIU37664.1 hypothetical protein TUM4445_30470 [Shewanella sp. MBTL60-112-B2]
MSIRLQDEQELTVSIADIIYLFLGLMMIGLVALNDWPSVISMLIAGVF